MKNNTQTWQIIFPANPQFFFHQNVYDVCFDNNDLQEHVGLNHTEGTRWLSIQIDYNSFDGTELFLFE